MSICRARLRNTSNALTFRMSIEQMRLQVSPVLLGVNSWMAQMTKQWIGPAMENARVPKVLRRTLGADSWCHDIWQIADAGDQELTSETAVYHYRSKRISLQICDIVLVAIKASARKRQLAWMSKSEAERQRTMPTSMSVGHSPSPGTVLLPPNYD